jgi:hypothetical protein
VQASFLHLKVGIIIFICKSIFQELEEISEFRVGRIPLVSFALLACWVYDVKKKKSDF